MSGLSVYLGERLVGELWQDPELGFSYDPNWLREEGAVPISRSLPLRSESFVGPPVRAFFAGVLPEADSRIQVAAVLGISADNDFAIIERIGGECAGAVSLWRAGVRPPAGAGLRWLGADELASAIRQLPQDPLLAGDRALRLSLAGAQVKLPVVLPSRGQDASGVAALPMGGTASTHIVKPEPERFPGLAANEAFCLLLARRAGLNASEAEWRRIGGVPCLLVRRYDRSLSGTGDVRRIHQEDFCQALGFPPERKYQQEGGPSLPECFALLRDWSTVPVLDIRDFLDGVIFACLTGNADAHGKNFSLLYHDGTRRLAPLYDQVCTLAWPELSSTLSLKIGSAVRLSEVSPEHFRQVASSARLGWPMVRERLADQCRRLGEIIRTEAFPDTLREAKEQIGGIVLDRSNRMLRLMER